jgi:nucleoside-diphosphate-sugar epimerase
MRTLVTGATGRVGSRFVPRLLEHEGEVVVLVRDEARGEPLRRHGAEVVAGDLRDAASRRRAVDGVDAVVHLAASFRGVPDEEAEAVNRTATVELARAAVDAGVGRFVLASTSLVYGAGRGRPPARTTRRGRRRPPTRPARPRPRRRSRSCTAATAWACGSRGWRSSTARATRTWPSP